jgi:hypothetical protein
VLWQDQGWVAGVTANNTLAMGENRLNIQVGGTYSAQTIGVPVGIGYDLVVDDATVWRFTGNTDVLSLADTPAGLVAFNWNKAMAERFRLSLGVGAYVGDNPLSGSGIDWIDDASILILPLPTIELWWKF